VRFNDERAAGSGQVLDVQDYTLTFHKITPGEGAEARFEQSDSR